METAADTGEEPEEPLYFAYCATLRIFGAIPDLDELTRSLGIGSTHAHRREDRHPIPYRHDMWNYMAPVNESEPLHVHIDSLWSVFRKRKEYLLQIKERLTVDVFLV